MGIILQSIFSYWFKKIKQYVHYYVSSSTLVFTTNIDFSKSWVIIIINNVVWLITTTSIINIRCSSIDIGRNAGLQFIVNRDVSFLSNLLLSWFHHLQQDRLYFVKFQPILFVDNAGSQVTSVLLLFSYLEYCSENNSTVCNFILNSIYFSFSFLL